MDFFFFSDPQRYYNKRYNSTMSGSDNQPSHRQSSQMSCVDSAGIDSGCGSQMSRVLFPQFKQNILKKMSVRSLKRVSSRHFLLLLNSKAKFGRFLLTYRPLNSHALHPVPHSSDAKIFTIVVSRESLLFSVKG